ncbi:MAG: PQQ-dependent sugar dehydrogenase [Dehalococcoidia bacterium]
MSQRIRLGLLLALVACATALFQNGPASAAGVDETDFDRGTVAGLGVTFSLPTSVAIGPDGRLYVAEQEGRIRALTLDPVTKAITAVEQVTSDADLQEVYGIAFDPTDASSPPPVYATNTVSGFGLGGGAPDGTFPGKVTKIDGPGYSTITDVITGLSVSNSAHQANGLAFAPDGTLYIAHGSTTNAGINVPGGPLFKQLEVPLSGAILVADPSAPAFDGNITYSPAGVYGTTVDQVSGDVSVYAAGLRNPYDVVVHTNGNIYATDNGPNAGLGGGSTSCSTEDPDPWAPSDRGPDELNLIEAGDYYGHPNRNRGRFDARQCVYHNGNEGDGADWTGPIELLPVSSDGLVEYTLANYGGKLLGDLFYAALIDGVLGRIELSPDGESVANHETFASGFIFPLDVTVASDGTIYVAEYGGNTITYLKPQEAPPSVGGISRAPSIAPDSGGGSGLGWLFLAAGGLAAAVGSLWDARRRRA